MTVEICFKPVMKRESYESTGIIQDTFDIQRTTLIKYILINASNHKVTIEETPEETKYSFYSGREMLTYEEIILRKPESETTINFLNYKLTKREKTTK